MQLNQDDIKAIIPHREPFLLVDEIEEMEPGVHAIGYKNVTGEEDFFRGHFPQYPVMPGVLIVEALAQVGAVSVLSMPENKGKLAFFGGIDKAKFRRQVRPGDRLKLEVEITRCKGPMGVGHAVATVDGEKAAEADIKFMLADAE